MELFEGIVGFDERLPTLGQVIDLCLKLRLAGKFILTVSDLVLIHEESSTKESVFPISEVEYFYRKWEHSPFANSRPIMKWSEHLYISPLKWKYPAASYVNAKKNAGK